MVRQVLLSASIAVCGLALARAATAQDRALTARELVQLATSRNRELLAARQRIAEAQGLLRQAGIRLAPTVEVEAGTGRPLGTHGEEEYSASYFHPIEMGGKRSKRVDVGEKGVALAEAEFADRARDIAFDVKMRAADAYAAQQKSDALARLLAAGQESYRLTKARVDEGDAATLDAQLLMTEMNRSRAQQLSATGRARSALSELRRAIGLDAADTLRLSRPSALDFDVRLEDLKTRALRQRPDVQVARLLEEQAAAELALSHAQGVPDLTASAKYTHRTTEFENLYGLNALGVPNPLRDRDNVLTFGLSIPIFTSGRNAGNVDAATARLSAARQHREAIEAAVPHEVDAAYQRWTAAKEAVALFQHGVVDQSEKNLNVMRQAYTLGQLRLIDVLNEQRRLVDTELAYIDAQTELAQASADLERAMGSDLP
jgi:cobalt-zinc-cadmium efflux system outer membrane protein